LEKSAVFFLLQVSCGPNVAFFINKETMPLAAENVLDLTDSVR
jgi:hypothetical protein